MRFVFWIFITLNLIGLIQPLSACASQVSKSEQEELFSKGLLGGCGADLAVLQNTSEKAVVSNLEECARNVFSLCKLELGTAKEIVLTKSKFFGDQSSLPRFLWTDAKKKLYSDVLLRKLCAGAISQKTLRELDAVFFLNTDCTGEGYLREIDRLKSRPGIDDLRTNSSCDMGGAASFSVPLNGKSYALKVLFVNPAASLQGLADGDTLIGQLDSSLVHEFTHMQRQNDHEFRRWTDQVIGVRFEKLQKDYLREIKRVESDINAQARRIGRGLHSDDQAKSLEIESYAGKRMSLFRDWLSQAKIPLRHGMAAKGRLWSEGHIEDQAGGYTLKDVPVFKNGRPSKFKFHDLLSGDGPYSVEALDSYALKNKEEYIAVALEIYWHNRAWARQVLAKEGLQLIDKNWRSGYFSR